MTTPITDQTIRETLDAWPDTGDVLELPGTGHFSFIDPTPGFLCAIGDMIDPADIDDDATVWHLAQTPDRTAPAFVKSER